MTKQVINIGTAPNAKNGDALRTAFEKVNANFTELYSSSSFTGTTDRLVNGESEVVLDEMGMLTVPGTIAFQDGIITGNDNSDPGMVLGSSNKSVFVSTLSGVDQYKWRFGTDGNLTFPDDLTINTGIIGKAHTDTVVVEDLAGTTTSTDTTESQIEIETTGIVIAKRIIQTVDDGIVSSTDTQGSVVELTDSNATIKHYEDPAGPNNGVYRQFTTVDGAIIETVQADVGSTTFGRVNATLGLVQISAGDGNTSKAWVFNNDGLLSLPAVLPTGFTAVLDNAHIVDAVTLVGDVWEFDIEFTLTSDGQVETIIGNNVAWPSNPGYVTGYTFDYTEADHGIPNYTFTLELTDVQHPGEFIYTANLAASTPPKIPNSITSASATKVHGYNSVILSNGNGVHEERFIFSGRNLILPGNGDIKDYLGNSVLGTSSDRLVNGSNAVILGTDGLLTFPGEAGFQATFGSVFPVGDVLHSINNLHLESEQAVTVNSGDQVADLENTYINLELIWEIVRDQDAQIIAPDTRPWDGMPSYEAYPVLMNYNSELPGGVLPPASNMAPTAKAASDAYDFWQEELTASGVNISVAGSKVWNFSGDGSTTLPGKLHGVVEIDAETETQTGHTLSIAPAGDYTSKSFNFRVDQYQGPGSFTRAFLDMPTAEVNKPVAIAFPLADSGSGSIFNQGNNTNDIGMNNAFNIFRNGGDVKITSQASSGGFNLYTWKFANNGNLTLPAGGDILDSNGASVLGGTIQYVTKPSSRFGQSGDVKGQIAIDSVSGDIYICINDYTDGLVANWTKLAGDITWTP
jgi:hypothetical protein